MLRSIASSFVSAAVASPPLHSLKSPSRIFGGSNAAVVHDRGEAFGLILALPIRGTEVDVEEVQRLSSTRMSARWQQRGSHVRQDRSYCTCWRMGKCESTTFPN